MNRFGPILGLLIFAAIIAASAFAPSSCASADSSDRELAFAQAGLSAARVAYGIAQAESVAIQANPSTSPIEKQLAASAAKEAGDALTREQTRVDKLIADRAAAKLSAAKEAASVTAKPPTDGPLNPLLPPP